MGFFKNIGRAVKKTVNPRMHRQKKAERAAAQVAQNAQAQNTSSALVAQTEITAHKQAVDEQKKALELKVTEYEKVDTMIDKTKDLLMQQSKDISAVLKSDSEEIEGASKMRDAFKMYFLALCAKENGIDEFAFLITRAPADYFALTDFTEKTEDFLNGMIDAVLKKKEEPKVVDAFKGTAFRNTRVAMFCMKRIRNAESSDAEERRLLTPQQQNTYEV